jgi:hypothetical protein
VAEKDRGAGFLQHFNGSSGLARTHQNEAESIVDEIRVECKAALKLGNGGVVPVLVE